jgi:hypothetical protein
MSRASLNARGLVARSRPHRGVAAACVLIALLPCVARCQIAPNQANDIRAGIENRVEALTILGGDFGLSDGTYSSQAKLRPGQASANVESRVTKAGGDGDIGDPRPLGDLNVGWQPRLQGNFGYLESTNLPRAGLRANDSSEYTTYAIEFGGGARFWLSDHFSLAPTLMGLYGHTSNNYTARSAFMKANKALATQLGLIDWSVDTWTLRPALNVQYVMTLGRSIITLSSDPTYFHTEGFHSSNSNVRINGDSESLSNKIDLDVPLRMELYGHELRSGGYLSRTDLFGDLRDGLGVQHMNEIHGRLVLDFLNQLWKFQWIGVGASYIWGTNITGWTAGADVAFRF